MTQEEQESKAQKAIAILKLFDEAKPLKEGAKQTLHKYSVRFFLLLLAVYLHEGDTQVFYKKLLGWNAQNINMHTNSLVDAGFLVFDDVPLIRFNGRPAKKVLVTAAGREFIHKVLCYV
ncbi:MAG: hypothetical protein LUC34_02520 [Campylobacter sp.]|nr:hypothetical protein [Campylobacter sp.]